MDKQAFRLDSRTLSFLATKATRRTPVMIPAEALVTLVGGDLNGNQLIDVEWNGQILRVFAADLRARGQAVELPPNSGLGNRTHRMPTVPDMLA